MPNYEQIMAPMLRFLSDGQERTNKELVDYISNFFQLTEEEKKLLSPSGTPTVIVSRVGWAKTFLRQAGLIEYPKRGSAKITEDGLKARNKYPNIKVKDLYNFAPFLAFVERSKSGNRTVNNRNDVDVTHSTPEELIEQEYSKSRQKLVEEVLSAVQTMSPQFFERLVVDLIIKMGYGGFIEERGFITKSTNDEGIDGIIKEDTLGLEVIYIQAKKYSPDNKVQRPELQKFSGALMGKRAKKGIFITTSSFSTGARDYIRNIDMKIIAIDGRELANLMIDYNVGVSINKVYELKKVDSDYFIEI